ncbi:Na+/H+ antiporter subunit A [Schaalia sp. lx-100]|uniref:Na+/H+ antiporter subunit A n=1 Tax=Schaalia sp. lx-100 TaxID=2899081 RepID=UPI001E4523DE|nr:Na+/H+ antiporter subunit A [Schaalia sp. lx-100]MCD4557492.1 Na+/H+ antiporter subunit A [Schaalia sp. lx-100]
MFAVIVAHMCAAICAFPCIRLWGRKGLAFLALVPGLSVALSVWYAPTILSGTVVRQSIPWVPALGLSFDLRMDVLAWVMTFIIGGVGALVLLYASAYFTDKSVGLRRFGAVFVAFAGVMYGLVLADHTIVLYTLWEATSLLSFLLIGHYYDRRLARMAARQALLVTSSGALAMFAGLVILGSVDGGSYIISELVANAAQGTLDTSSPVVIVAVFLVLAGALSKSAQIPFHFWLPGAMTAPTPVSAYLHAAAMVKAGVYLVARLTPGFVHIPGFSLTLVILGVLTMCVGALRALRQYDLKLLLAYGTVSQLGLMMATIAQGSAGAMAAGLTMLVSHAFFKSSLFLTVGAVEQATGRRDWRRLSGLGRRKPFLAAASALALASMSGVPITTGYLGKEAIISTLWHGSHSTWLGQSSSHTADALLLVCIALGSILTGAYAWRAWWGAFGTRQAVTPEALEKEQRAPAVTPTQSNGPVPAQTTAPTPASHVQENASDTSQTHTDIHAHKCTQTPWMMTLVIVFLSLGALLGFFPHTLENIFSSYAAGYLPGHAHLAWWSGWVPALVTAAILSISILMAYAATHVENLQSRWAFPIAIVDMYAWSIHELEIIAARITRLLQRGSLPWELSTIVTTLIVCVGSAMIAHPPRRLLVNWADSSAQIILVLCISAAAILTVRSRGRMRAALLLGAVGLGIAVLWASQGAPDLAVTQIVVEAVGIVVFILVLRRLPTYFSDRPHSTRWWRLLLAFLSGAGVVFAGLYASSARIHETVSTLMPTEALDFGYGKNIVNVILVDIRAWDTVGELSVLLVIATGVASLIHVRSRGRTPQSITDLSLPYNNRFLPAVTLTTARERSTVMEVVTHILFPTLLVLSIWLLLIGHNNPGGGFVGGVVAGIAFLLRYLAAGRYELAAAMPISPGRILGMGLFLAGLGALLPLITGNSVLQSTAIDWDLGVLGSIHFTTAMLLDIGVYVLVLGVVLDLVSTLGSEIDRHAEMEATQ